MQVFFSWSGEASRLAAVALSTCVSEVIQAVEPWLSEAIAKGAQWREQLNTGLEKSRIGVCCLTRENLKAEWILFEAGAISMAKDARLCTFLLDLKPTDVAGPLAGFQHTVPEKADIKKLLQMINGAVLKSDERSISDTQLDKLFDRAWPDLERALISARKAAPQMKRPQRSERELLEEILEQVRQVALWAGESAPLGSKVAVWGHLATQAADAAATPTGREVLKALHRQRIHEQLVLEEPELGLHPSDQNNVLPAFSNSAARRKKRR